MKRRRDEHCKKIENLVSRSSLLYHAQGSEKKSDISGRDGLSGAFASIKNSLERHKCILHAYCLMTNHIHLLLETGDMEIWKFMKYMSECYAMYLKAKVTGYSLYLFTVMQEISLRIIMIDLGINMCYNKTDCRVDYLKC